MKIIYTNINFDSEFVMAVTQDVFIIDTNSVQNYINTPIIGIFLFFKHLNFLLFLICGPNIFY